MSKRRKNGQGSRYQRDRRAGGRRGGGPVSLSEMFAGSVPDLALAQLFRSECSRCGCRQLRWFTGADAAGVLGQVEAVDLLADMPAEHRGVADCWLCTKCGEFGAFGPSEWEPF